MDGSVLTTAISQVDYSGQGYCPRMQSCPPVSGSVQFSSVSRVRLFAIPWITACQVSLSITSSQSSPKPMSIESVIPSNHLILFVPFSSCPQSFPASGSFPMSQLFASGGQSTGVSASASVPPINTLCWVFTAEIKCNSGLISLGWTGWISLQSKGLPGWHSAISALKRVTSGSSSVLLAHI